PQEPRFAADVVGRHVTSRVLIGPRGCVLIGLSAAVQPRWGAPTLEAGPSPGLEAAAPMGAWATWPAALTLVIAWVKFPSTLQPGCRSPSLSRRRPALSAPRRGGGAGGHPQTRQGSSLADQVIDEHVGDRPPRVRSDLPELERRPRVSES